MKSEVPLSWKNKLTVYFNDPNLKIIKLKGDGSGRHYYRIEENSGVSLAIIMQVFEQDKVLLQRQSYPWTNINSYLHQNAINVPEIFFIDKNSGIICMQDLGSIHLFDHVQNKPTGEVISAYKRAIDIINEFHSFQVDQTQVWCKRAFDAAKLKTELDKFYEHYLTGTVGVKFTDRQISMWRAETKDLCEYLASFSKYFTHRDFHSRNILVHEGRLSVIDFQDAMIGSPSYDLISLVYDPYVNLPKLIRDPLIDYCVSISKNHVQHEILTSMKATGLQRLLKILGTYGFFENSLNLKGFIKYCEPTLEFLLDLFESPDKRWPFLTGELIEILKCQGNKS